MKIITSRAMKANRTYKHVVQNVEKFISKSEPKYKLAGLYVMDSIIRRSRNDFGPERDVYAPRFQKVFINSFRKDSLNCDFFSFVTNLSEYGSNIPTPC